MAKSPAKLQALLALGLALLLWGAWSAFGTPLRVRWLVARGAPPASVESGEAALEAIRAVGPAAASTLVSILGGDGTRARKSWVASALLRAPFFAKGEVEAALGSPVSSTRRAAAFTLMGGDEGSESFESRAAQLKPGAVQPPRAPARETWDPAPALPVLIEWVADQGDLEARFAARLLGTLPADNPEVREALLKVVEEVPQILGPGAHPNLQLRKFTVVDALQALLPWAKKDPEVVARVSGVITWIEDEKLSDAGGDLQGYALALIEISGGRGVDPALLRRLADSPNPILRQRLAGTLETVPGPVAVPILGHLVFDETAVVRRAAVLCLKNRLDPILLDLAPVLMEDSYIYIRSDALKSIGELRGVEPLRCRAMTGLLVSAIEEPWQGEDAVIGTPMAAFQHAGMIEVVETAALSLWQVAMEAPGFMRKGEKGETVNDIFDWKKRGFIAQRIVDDPKFREEVVAEWRKLVPARDPADRIPALVRRLLEDRDPENTVRAIRELVRLTGDSATFPPASLVRKDTDLEARNAVREWWKQGGREKAREHWAR